MEDKITLIELDIDTDKATQDVVALRLEIEKLKEETVKLEYTEGKTSEAYVKKQAELKATQNELRQTEKVLVQLTNAEKQEAGTLEKLEAKNNELRLERRKLNLETEEGRKRQKEINDELDVNTKFIKDNSDQQKRNILNVGNYTQSIIEANKALKEQEKQLLAEKEALARVDKSTLKTKEQQKEYKEEVARTNSELKKTQSELAKTETQGNSLQKTYDELPGSLGGAAKGFLGMAKAALAFIATPIGAILTVIVGAFTLLYKSLTSTEAGMAKMNKIGAAFSGVFSGIMKVLRPLAEFIADKIIVVFDALGEAASDAIDIVSKGLSLLGFDKAAANVKAFNESIADTAKKTMELVDAEAQLKISQRESMKIQLDFQKLAEKQRQIRDDESLSIGERMAANEQLNEILKQQLAAEIAIANQALKVADLRIAAEGENTDALDQRAEALTTISDIQERITGQESEYLSNINGLRREQLAIDKERAAEAVRLFELESAAELKKIQDAQTAYAESLAETARLDEMAAASAEALAQRKEDSRKAREDRKREADALNYANEYELAKMNLFAQLDLERENLKLKEQQEIDFANKIGANTELIESKYSEARKEIARLEFDAKLSLAAGFAGNIATIFGEQTAIGKAAAIAQTTIATYQGATQAFTSFSGLGPIGVGLGIAAAAAAIAAGLKNVQKIIQTKSGLPGGGKGGASMPSGGGSGYGGTASFANINPAIGQGIISRETTPQVQGVQMKTQTVLVEDSVTYKQKQSENIAKTAVI